MLYIVTRLIDQHETLYHSLSLSHRHDTIKSGRNKIKRRPMNNLKSEFQTAIVLTSRLSKEREFG